MRNFRGLGLAAALLTSMAIAPVRAADDDEATETKPSSRGINFRWSPVFAKMAGIDQRKPLINKSAEKPKKESVKKKPPAPDVEESIVQRNQAEADLLRRLKVIDKLREDALQKGDEELLKKAQDLDDQAQKAYTSRLNKIPGGGAGFESDEKTLDKVLGNRTIAAKKSSDSPSGVAERKDKSQAANKEANP